jgi:hypothetical protein
MEPRTYRMYPLWRVQILGMFVLFAVVGVVVVVAGVVASSGPPLFFALVWVLVVIWNGYWFLFRIAYRLDLTESSLAWRTPLRSGTIALIDLVEMRPSRFGSSAEVLRLSDGSKVLVMVRKGFVDFMAEVQAAAPHVEARVGTFAKIGERLPGPRGFRRQ